MIFALVAICFQKDACDVWLKKKKVPSELMCPAFVIFSENMYVICIFITFHLDIVQGAKKKKKTHTKQQPPQKNQ